MGEAEALVLEKQSCCPQGEGGLLPAVETGGPPWGVMQVGARNSVRVSTAASLVMTIQGIKRISNWQGHQTIKYHPVVERNEPELCESISMNLKSITEPKIRCETFL